MQQTPEYFKVVLSFSCFSCNYTYFIFLAGKNVIYESSFFSIFE